MDELAAATRRYRQREVALDDARAELYEAIRAADAAGRPKAEIARVTGFTRQTVYDVIDAGRTPR